MDFKHLIGLLAQTHDALQRQAARSVDIALVVRNWLFGWYIVEFESGGAERSTLYGKKLIHQISATLGKQGVRGVSTTNLKQCRKFYLAYEEIGQTLSDQSLSMHNRQIHENGSDRFLPFESLDMREKVDALAGRFRLGWSHYVTLLTIDDPAERRFYEIEAEENSWSVRELRRQIDASLYERLALSRDKTEIRRLSEQGLIIEKTADIIKNPYVLEFLDLPQKPAYTEHDLETAIIDKIEQFLLELGKGFLFEARQKRFTFDDDHFYVDLVFYNRLLRCYVLIDLKRDKLTHQDLGQMQMYVNYFDRYVKLDDEAPTVGILLCHRKNDALVELTLPKGAHIYAAKYQLYLPSKEELRKQMEKAERELEEER